MDEKELKTLNNLVTAAKILVLVSVFIFGVPLDIAALICIYIASRRLKEITGLNTQSNQSTQSIQNTQGTHVTQDTQALQLLQRSIRLVTLTCVIIMVINLISLYIMYPYYLEMLNEIMTQSTSLSTSTLSNSAAQGSIWG